MSNIAIVAIPEERDPVWKVSSEKVPHMTLLFLGEGPLQNEEEIINYVQHVATTSMRGFGMTVERRGLLGPNKADVLFFGKGWDNKDIVDARGYLLADENISKAYEQAEQYEGWVPHLTLGYPETPAKPDGDRGGYLDYVSFNKIAIWTDDYDGPEFRLGGYESDGPSPTMYHSQMALAALGDSISHKRTDVLIHWGIKGMKWGIRRKVGPDGLVTGEIDKAASKNPEAAASGGGGGASAPASADHERAVAVIQKKNELGVQALSNQEMKDLTNRIKAYKELDAALSPQKQSELEKKVSQMRLENDYKKLMAQRKEAEKGFVRRLAESAVQNVSEKVSKDPIGFAKSGKDLADAIFKTTNQNGSDSSNTSTKTDKTKKARKVKSETFFEDVANADSDFGKKRKTPLALPPGKGG